MPLRSWIGTEPIQTQEVNQRASRVRRAIPFPSLFGGVLAPPNGTYWEIYAILARITTSAVVGNRQLILKGNYSGLTSFPYAGWYHDFTDTFPASTTRYFGWYRGVDSRTFSGAYLGAMAPLSDAMVFSDMNIVMSCEGQQAGDGGNAILLAYEYQV